jgi:hypothetical protein
VIRQVEAVLSGHFQLQLAFSIATAGWTAFGEKALVGICVEGSVLIRIIGVFGFTGSTDLL